jgi:lipoate-protein ligase A
MLQIFNTGINSAEVNMSNDQKLLESLSAPTLHLYRWRGPSATYGYFIDPEKHLDLKKTEMRRLDLARRPTGGGIVFHIWDLAFSFLLPSNHPAFSLNTLENYQFVNNIVLEVVKSYFHLDDTVELMPQNGVSLVPDHKSFQRDLRPDFSGQQSAENAGNLHQVVEFERKVGLEKMGQIPKNFCGRVLGPDCQNFCMAKPTQYDVVYKGMKIAGSAQRKRKQGYLHQGTISLAYPQLDLLKDVLLSKEDVLEAMQSFTFAPLGRIWEMAHLQKTRAEIEKLLAAKLQIALKF